MSKYSKYSWVFADRDTHCPIRTLQELKDSGNYNTSLGFYYNDLAIGRGELTVKSMGKKWVHTDSTRIFNKYRNKGHGLHLYRALIQCAQKLGAKRIYSSISLNRYSTKMWAKKLGKVGFVVKISKKTKKCYRCGCKKVKELYYIDL